MSARNRVSESQRDDKDKLLHRLTSCKTVNQVLRLMHTWFGASKSISMYKERSTARMLITEGGVNAHEYAICKCMYPGINLACLDQRVRKIRALLINNVPVQHTVDSCQDKCSACGSHSIIYDDVTSDSICTACGVCCRTLPPCYALLPNKHSGGVSSSKIHTDCMCVNELYTHIAHKHELGNACLHTACDYFMQVRMCMTHIEQYEYVVCACFVLAMQKHLSVYKPPCPHGIHGNPPRTLIPFQHGYSV